jgi:ATP-binding cassette subfamily C (CFTR/MRP) protein 1
VSHRYPFLVTTMLPTNSAIIICQNDVAVIGPTVIGCRDDFDFTVAFEQSFFAITASACFISLALARIWHLRRKPRIVNAPAFQYLKLVSWLGHMCGRRTVINVCDT